VISFVFTCTIPEKEFKLLRLCNDMKFVNINKSHYALEYILLSRGETARGISLFAFCLCSLSLLTRHTGRKEMDETEQINVI
jgi:hypothetical protein